MSVYTQVVLSPDPLYLQPKSYDARSDRKWFADIMSAGVVGSGDFAVTATAGNMNISVAAGVAYVLGQNIGDQGMYRQYSPSSNVMTVGSNASGNPRIDTVILRIMDNAADTSTFNEARIEIVPGTATAGADLNNLNGKANLTALGESSKSVLALCYILVPNAATVLTTAGSIKDARVRAAVGSGNAFGGVLLGSTIEWNASAPPGGAFYLTEDGSAISRTTYAQLLSVIGTAWGVGDGSTTFNIPDSRGRVPVGYAPSGGHADVSTVGNTDGLAVASRRVKHKHVVSLTDPGHRHSISVGNNGAGAGDGQISPGAGNFSTNVSGTSTTGSNMEVKATGITITVGPQTGAEPTDGSAYTVKHKLIRAV